MPATELDALMAWVNDPTRIIVAHLAKNFIPTTVDSVQLSDLVECDFPGYAPIRLDTWEPLDYGDDGYAEVETGDLEWVAGEAFVTPQGVCVVYLTIQEVGPATLLWPIPLASTRRLCIPGDEFVWNFNISSSNLDSLTATETEV